MIGVYTAADLGIEAVGLPCAWPITPDWKAPQRPLLASGTVHFAGEGVAVVVARTAAEARDAGDLVEVDYDPLEPVLDMEAALAEGATLVHPDLGTNENATWVFDSGEAGTGRQRRRRDRRRRGRPGLDRGQAPVPPAAADPGVHGAALLRGRPDRRAADRSTRPPRSRTSCAP